MCDAFACLNGFIRRRERQDAFAFRKRLHDAPRERVTPCAHVAFRRDFIDPEVTHADNAAVGFEPFATLHTQGDEPERFNGVIPRDIRAVRRFQPFAVWRAAN